MLIPGYNALAPHLRPVRDPALSLVALSGEDPTEPVMVEVPLVLNNTTFTATRALTGYRVGYVERYVQGNHVEQVEHSEALHQSSTPAQGRCPMGSGGHAAQRRQSAGLS